MRIVCISDTHEQHRQVDVPDGDLLLFAGDMSYTGKRAAIWGFNEWLGELPHKHKVVIAGNHDWMFERDPAQAEGLITNAAYLNDSGLTLHGLKIWGTPVQPEFCNWAFNRKRGDELRRHWELIPEDTNILVVHGPPYGIGDQSAPHRDSEHLGCEDLRAAVDRLPELKLCVFGHIHGGSGMYPQIGRMFVNASVLDEAYRPNGKQFVIDL